MKPSTGERISEEDTMTKEKNVVIVESPTKARTIEKYLGRDFAVISTMGHVRDLPKHRFGVNIAEGFVPTYEPLPERKESLKKLKTAVAGAKAIYLATDPDREGEAIAWHVREALKLKDPHRIEFHEVTKEAVRQALEHPREIDMQRVEAQQARRILDRIVGYMLSPLISKKIRSRLSAGRVQSVAVRLICEREREIQQFVPEEYWSITATLTPHEESFPFDAKLVRRGDEKIKIATEQQAQEILKDLDGASWQVLRVEEKEQRRHAPLPFTTSTLQQEASKRLGFSTKKTMSVAQELYEGIELGPEGATGLITYMRTDSTRVAEEAQTQAREFIASHYGKEFVRVGAGRKAKKVNVQDAHEAIRPTDVRRLPDDVAQYLSPDQLKLYRLVWQRFVASQMAPAVFDVVSVDIQAKEYIFRATGSVLKFSGWLAVYEETRDEDAKADDDEAQGQLPPLREQQILDLIKLTPKQHFTEPPPRYTEATLVKALEENGIGRPSTYAPTISTILERGYVKLEKRRFVPTELGFLVTDALVKHFPKIVDVGFTALIEEELDKIEEGQLDRLAVLQDFYKEFASAYEKAKTEMESLKPKPIETEEICPECGSKLVIRSGRYGQFYSCSTFPKCRYTRPYITLALSASGEGTGEVSKSQEREAQAEQTAVCPKCGAPMVLRRGRYGPFYGCSRYPDCDGIVNIERVREESSVPCPKCGGKLLKRYARKGGRSFFGCEHYPKCDFTVSQTPVKPCPSCKEGVLVESQDGGLVCSNKQCGHREDLSPGPTSP
jgi:DNA topoisomerase-1